MTLNNLVIFCYDFPHLKSKLGLQLLDIFGPKKCTIIASPWEKLDIRKSKIRTITNEIEYLHPKEISNKNGWDYFAYKHNSPDTIKLLKKIKPNFGIILGSRILSGDVIKSFNEGILNFHPGLLPENRGLNTIQNAVLKNIPQAVTLHFIDTEIDKGRKILTNIVDVEMNDNLFDIQKKITNTEMSTLKNLLQNRIKFDNLLSLKTDIALNKIIEEGDSEKFYSLFDVYKKNYKNIINSYKNND